MLSIELPESGTDAAGDVPSTPEELCRRCAPRVARFASLVARDRSEAEDIAQEALIKAIRGLRTYRPEAGDFESWLWRIVINTSNDFSRSRMRRLRLVLRLGTLPPRANPQPEEIAINRLAAGDVRSALERLSARDRTVLALRFGAGMGIRQVAECTAMSTDAAEKAVQRAMQRLRAAFLEFRDGRA